ncbi:MAG: hypothetical protein FXV79_05580, partial [Candidatus Thioglobus sp.]
MKIALITLLLAALISCSTAPTTPPPTVKIAKATNFKVVHKFIDKMVAKHDFDKNKLLKDFATVEFKIIGKTAKKSKKKKSKKVKQPPMSWDKYKKLTITEERIENGVKFWQNNLQTLLRAEKTYNVPAQIIVAILGIETRYGAKKGEKPT